MKDLIQEGRNIQETFKKNVNESTDYELKDDSGQGKPTVVLILQQSSWDKVKHLFDDKGGPISGEIKKIPSQNVTWTLHAQPFKLRSKTEQSYKIYGVSGDYTFGNAPTYYNEKYRGNKKAAKEVFDIFINKFLK